LQQILFAVSKPNRNYVVLTDITDSEAQLARIVDDASVGGKKNILKKKFGKNAIISNNMNDYRHPRHELLFIFLEWIGRMLGRLFRKIISIFRRR